RLEVGEVLSVAVGGDVLTNDGKEPFGASDAPAFADTAERFPHGPWDAEPGLVGVAGRCGVRHGVSFGWLLFLVTHWWCPFAGRCGRPDRKSTRLNSSHVKISYAVFCLKKK